MREGFAQDIPDIMLVCFKQWPNRKRWVGSELRYQLSCRTRMSNGFVRLFFKPLDDGNTVKAVHHKRIVRVVNGPRQFHFKDSIQRLDDLLPRFLVHASSSSF